MYSLRIQCGAPVVDVGSRYLPMRRVPVMPTMQQYGIHPTCSIIMIVVLQQRMAEKDLGRQSSCPVEQLLHLMANVLGRLDSHGREPCQRACSWGVLTWGVPALKRTQADTRQSRFPIPLLCTQQGDHPRTPFVSGSVNICCVFRHHSISAAATALCTS